MKNRNIENSLYSKKKSQFFLNFYSYFYNKLQYIYIHAGFFKDKSGLFVSTLISIKDTCIEIN